MIKNFKNLLKVSIITATWNSESTILECLDSVGSQSYKNLEHIIVDGKSSDGTVNIINSTINNINSTTIFISEPDNGIYDALNKGIMASTGEIIGFLHSDDLYSNSNILSHVMESFTDPNICAVYGDLQYVKKDDTTKVIRKWKSSHFQRWKLYFGWMPPHPTLFVRREWYKKIGNFDTRYKISADYDSILSLFLNRDFIVKYIPILFIKMRMGGASNRSLVNVILKSKEDLCIARNHKLGSIFPIFFKNISKIIQLI